MASSTINIGHREAGLSPAGSSWTQDYTYDRWGNRTATETVLASGLSTQAVDIEDPGGVPNNRIASVAVNGVPGSAYQYDQNGNVIFDGAFTYVYDSANRLREVRTGSTVLATYAYDAANRRVKQTEGGTVRYSFWEGMHVVTEYTIPVSSGTGGTPTLAAQYVFAGSRMIAYENPTTVNFTHPDRLSTRMITSSTGSIVGTQSHRLFGEDDTSANLNDKHRFTNYERDTASGLDYAMNRHYANGVAGFSQADPLPGSPLDPGTLNRYAYATGDPVNLNDPTGLFTTPLRPPPPSPGDIVLGYAPSFSMDSFPPYLPGDSCDQTLAFLFGSQGAMANSLENKGYPRDHYIGKGVIHIGGSDVFAPANSKIDRYSWTIARWDSKTGKQSTYTVAGHARPVPFSPDETVVSQATWVKIKLGGDTYRIRFGHVITDLSLSAPTNKVLNSAGNKLIGYLGGEGGGNPKDGFHSHVELKKVVGSKDVVADFRKVFCTPENYALYIRTRALWLALLAPPFR